MDGLGIRYEHRGRVTEAYVRWEPAGHLGFCGHGSALRSKKDVAFSDVGDNIALGRAIQDLGIQVEMIGHAQCVTKDEYARVTHLMERRPPSASMALREMVEANL